MGILDNVNSAPISPAKKVATQLKQQTIVTYRQLVSAFILTSKLFWDNRQATPQEIAAELGEDAAEMFDLHGKIGALLATVKPEDIQAAVALVGDFTVNEDGTVTIPAPEAE